MSLLPLAVASIGGSLISGLGSSSAAKTQAAAAKQAADAQLQLGRENLAFQDDVYKDITANFAPWLQSGKDAQAVLDFELFGGDRPMVGGTFTPLDIETFTEMGPVPAAEKQGRLRSLFNTVQGREQPTGATLTPVTRYRVGGNVFDTLKDAEAYADKFGTTSGGTEYQGYQKTPGYDFRMKEGLDAVNSSVARRQGLVSGAAQEAATKFGQNFATNEYTNYLNRIAGQSGAGQAAAGGQANAGQYYGGTVGSIFTNMGGAQAQGITGAGNAKAAGTIGMTNAFNQGIGDTIGTWAYLKGKGVM